MGTPEAVDVYLEVGPKRTFAGALEWPGWSRSGRTEVEALASLAEYGRRYAAVLAGTGIAFVAPLGPAGLAVRERLVGNATTDFGAPGIPPAADSRPLDGLEFDRLSRLLEACWEAFDRTAEAAAGIALRTGPRGGGRDLDAMIGHVIGAEEAYLNALGARAPAPVAAAGQSAAESTAEESAAESAAEGESAAEDVADHWGRLRAIELAAFAARARGEMPANPSQSRKLWLPRYFVRRTAWHVLDHLWEIDDRAAPVE